MTSMLAKTHYGDLLTRDGLLPLWMATISAIALFNAVQNYLTISLTKRVYSKKAHEVTRLSARTFGVWTFTSALIRMYAALNIHDPTLYQLALYSYYIAAFHFGTEIFVYQTAAWGAISPVIVSTTSIVWMLLHKSHYIFWMAS